MEAWTWLQYTHEMHTDTLKNVFIGIEQAINVCANMDTT